MTSWQVAFGTAGLIVTLSAVLLAAWLSARSVARLCMRREHREMRARLEATESFVIAATVRDGEMRRRLDRIEMKLDEL